MTEKPIGVQLEDRAVLAVGGADARPFLQGLLTHDLDLLGPARPLYAGLLSPQGKTLFDMLLFDGGAAAPGAVLIDVAADRAPALARRLAMYKLRKAVTIEAADLAVFAGWHGGEATHPPDPRFAALGARWLAAPDVTVPPGAAIYDAHRLAIGVPGSADIGEDALLWLETGADLLAGVSFTKGCYVGQENTARMHYRDKIRRRLVPVRFDGAPSAGAPVLDTDGRSVGTLRSWRGAAGIAHLQLVAALAPLVMAGAPLTAMRPAWLEPALAAAVAAT